LACRFGDGFGSCWVAGFHQFYNSAHGGLPLAGHAARCLVSRYRRFVRSVQIQAAPLTTTAFRSGYVNRDVPKLSCCVVTPTIKTTVYDHAACESGTYTHIE